MSADLSEMIQNVEKEFQSVEHGEGWPSFFQCIRQEMLNQTFDSIEAKKTNNKKLNRYQDVYPYDHSRIILKNGPCDYINASLVTVSKADRKYILAQGPLPHTTSHYWLMVWQENSGSIVMLNRVIEKNMIKCHQYWPQTAEDDFVFNDVGLKVSYISDERASYYVVTKLKLENVTSGESRVVVHFHYTTWPDFGVPQSPTAFLKFLRLVRASGTLSDSSRPPVIHCSAGIGRSGTFCLVDSCLLMIKEMGLDNVVVRDVLVEMRHSRMGLVQTHDQLRFSYLAILEGLQSDGTANGNLYEECEEEEEDEPPPLPPPRGESLRSRAAGSSSNRSEISEEQNLAKQRRDEKLEKLDSKVKEVKSKLKQTEYWQGVKKSVWKPLGYGLLFVGSGIFLYVWLKG